MEHGRAESERLRGAMVLGFRARATSLASEEDTPGSAGGLHAVAGGEADAELLQDELAAAEIRTCPEPVKIDPRTQPDAAVAHAIPAHGVLARVEHLVDQRRDTLARDAEHEDLARAGAR